MSNRRRPALPPGSTAPAVAAGYLCSHCTSFTDLRWNKRRWTLTVRHEDGCPVLLGTISSAPDVLRAVRAAGSSS